MCYVHLTARPAQVHRVHAHLAQVHISSQEILVFKHALILIMAVITFALFVLINASIVHHQHIVFHAKEGIRLTPTKHV